MKIFVFLKQSEINSWEEWEMALESGSTVKQLLGLEEPATQCVVPGIGNQFWYNSCTIRLTGVVHANFAPQRSCQLRCCIKGIYVIVKFNSHEKIV